MTQTYAVYSKLLVVLYLTPPIQHNNLHILMQYQKYKERRPAHGKIMDYLLSLHLSFNFSRILGRVVYSSSSGVIMWGSNGPILLI